MSAGTAEERIQSATPTLSTGGTPLADIISAMPVGDRSGDKRVRYDTEG
ncbi:MAG: hypothetical protein OXU81_21965 [Gammaproteobacteria bacterium]|nr:hypothetical protein [Gammaproteobacteria bacterium]